MGCSDPAAQPSRLFVMLSSDLCKGWAQNRRFPLASLLLEHLSAGVACGRHSNANGCVLHPLESPAAPELCREQSGCMACSLLHCSDCGLCAWPYWGIKIKHQRLLSVWKRYIKTFTSQNNAPQKYHTIVLWHSTSPTGMWMQDGAYKFNKKTLTI